jgi:hypothetical protein
LAPAPPGVHLSENKSLHNAHQRAEDLIGSESCRIIIHKGEYHCSPGGITPDCPAGIPGLTTYLLFPLGRKEERKLQVDLAQFANTFTTREPGNKGVWVLIVFV